MTRDIIRRCRFTPYRKDCGPTFSLTLWDTGRTDWRGCSKLGYRLTMRDLCGRCGQRTTITLFQGEDFSGSPLHADDSDDTVKSLMGFLTLRPGDTDSEYFAEYTERQLDYCSLYAEDLASEVYSRFEFDD